GADRSARDGERGPGLRRRPGGDGRPGGGRGRGARRGGLRVTATAQLSRTVIDLDAGATVLDAARRIDDADASADIVLVVPAAAPLVRHPVFFMLPPQRARRQRPVVVTFESLASSDAACVDIP